MFLHNWASSGVQVVVMKDSAAHCKADLFLLCGIIRMMKLRRMRLAMHVARMGEKRNAYRILVGKPEGKRPLGRPRRRYVGNFKMDLREIGLVVMDRIDLAQDRDQWRALVNTVMNLRVP
jgi:hypothetical protein